MKKLQGGMKAVILVQGWYEVYQTVNYLAEAPDNISLKTQCVQVKVCATCDSYGRQWMRDRITLYSVDEQKGRAGFM